MCLYFFWVGVDSEWVRTFLFSNSLILRMFQFIPFLSLPMQVSINVVI